MKFVATSLAGVVSIRSEPASDPRGSFARAYCEAEFVENGLEPVGLQCSLSVNPKRGTLRGMHYQAAPGEEAKLVRCVHGRLFDVAIDLRPSSTTFKRWVGVELDAGRGDALYIPKGCAHGFLTLADDTVVYYQMGTPHAPDLARGVRWDDPLFAIRWPFPPLHIGERDASYADFAV